MECMLRRRKSIAKNVVVRIADLSITYGGNTETQYASGNNSYCYVEYGGTKYITSGDSFDVPAGSTITLYAGGNYNGIVTATEYRNSVLTGDDSWASTTAISRQITVNTDTDVYVSYVSYGSTRQCTVIYGNKGELDIQIS